ncbi:bacteriocin immunity protein [Enterococcus hirae]|jgi:kynureninase|nr:bacteriocin immunity protein [Enterococcaceae bacterium]MDM8213923.1 bacteriocin immunity protein [Enterococcus hirae]
MKKKRQEEKKQAITLFLELKILLEEDQANATEYFGVIQLLDGAVQRVSKEKQIPQLQAGAVFENVCALALVEKVKFSAEASAALQRIKEFAQPKGILGGFSLFNVVNLFPLFR